MAYRRYKRYGRRRRYRRKNVPRAMTNSQAAYKLAMTAYKSAKFLKGIINSEKKHFDVQLSGAISDSGTITSLNSIAQGDSNVTRDGNSILVKSLLFRARYVRNSSATSSVVRYIIFEDTQQVADTAPAVADVLQFTGDATVSPLNRNTIGRFKVLVDKTCTVDSGSLSTKMVEHFIPMDHHIRFNGTLASDVQKGGLYLLQVSTEATNTVDQETNTRLSYYDN